MTALRAETVDFGGLRITFDERVLRPRGWTAQQSSWAADLLAGLAPGPVLELCSGAGHIGLLAVAANDRPLVCVDVSEVAAGYAVRNAQAAGLAHRVEVRCGAMLDVVRTGERFPLVVADPPWVPRSETARFPEDPMLAIDGGDDGLGVVRECLVVIEEHLAPGGVALLQVGPGNQAELVAATVAGTQLRAGEVRRFGERGTLLRLDRAAVGPG